jgi:CHAT domain-containing protein/Tfp pilus assembly protein PilF
MKNSNGYRFHSFLYILNYFFLTFSLLNINQTYANHIFLEEKEEKEIGYFDTTFDIESPISSDKASFSELKIHGDTPKNSDLNTGQEDKTAQSQLNLARSQKEIGRYEESEEMYRASIVTYRKHFGMPNLKVAEIEFEFADFLLDRGKYAEAKSIAHSSLATRISLLGQENKNVAESMQIIGTINEELANYSEAEKFYKKALSMKEKIFGKRNERVALTLTSIASLYHRQSRYKEGENAALRSLSIFVKKFGENHIKITAAANALAIIYQDQGKYAEAKLLFRRTLTIAERQYGPEHINVGRALTNLAELQSTLREEGNTESMFLRSLAIYEKALGNDHQIVGIILNNIGIYYSRLKRYEESESLYKRSLLITEKYVGLEHPSIAISYASLAWLYQAQGRYSDALLFFQKSIPIRNKFEGKNSRGLSLDFSGLGTVYLLMGNYQEAEKFIKYALEIDQNILGKSHANVGLSLRNIGNIYRQQGKMTEAGDFFKKSIKIFEKSLGKNHPEIAQFLCEYAAVQKLQGKTDDALFNARRAVQLISKKEINGAEILNTRTNLSLSTNGPNCHELLLDLLYYKQDKKSINSEHFAAESFSASQIARFNDTAKQISKMSARLSIGEEEISAFVRERQDLESRLKEINYSLRLQILKSAPDRDNLFVEKLKVERDQNKQKLSSINNKLRKTYPRYSEFTTPTPFSISSLKKYLADDEAFFSIFVGHEASYAWFIKRNSQSFIKLPISNKEIDLVVKKLRVGLDILGSIDFSSINSSYFDTKLSHKFYNELFGPFQNLLKDVNYLIIVPDGALQSLPFGVLVTDASEKESINYAEVDWLAKRYAITTLPAVNSMRAIRAVGNFQTARFPFIGFGDPVLEGNELGESRSGSPRILVRGRLTDVDELRKLPQLPETSDELLAIAQALNSSSENIYLGELATETRLKSISLSNFKYLAFATHGLMAGEFHGLEEPALVLTPPSMATETDDGLLTASEIAHLKLNADFVILSACNTAAANGTPGAEGFSGLTKAFFYAGARSLLVSHWAINSSSTASLTVKMLHELANGTSKAEALRRSVISLLKEDSHIFSHPSLWAAFSLVGEGNQNWKINRKK